MSPNTQTTTMIERADLLAFVDRKLNSLVGVRNEHNNKYRDTGQLEFDRASRDCNLQINAYRIVTSYVESMQPYPVNATADGKPLPTPTATPTPIDPTLSLAAINTYVDEWLSNTQATRMDFALTIQMMGFAEAVAEINSRMVPPPADSTTKPAPADTPTPDPIPDATAHFSDLIHRKNNATLKDLTVVTLRDAHYDVLNTVDELKRQIHRLEALDTAIKQVVVVQ